MTQAPDASTTQPFFIVSSGRSGTQAMERLLGSYDNVEMHHEYLCTHLQPLAVRYYLGLADLDEACRELESTHGRALHYCEKPLFGDSSNKLAWLIEPLHRLFPGARFIHLVRDGRKVASSFLNKLGDECYDDRSTAILQRWYDDPKRHPAPPPEKRYWWNLPRQGDPRAAAFRGYNQFQRICFHWSEVNRTIQKDLRQIPAQQQRTYRLEDLTTQPAQLREMVEFLGLPYRDELAHALLRPHNVNRPLNFPLTAEQTRQFWAIAAETMHHFNYTSPREYEVIYNPDTTKEPDE